MSPRRRIRSVLTVLALASLVTVQPGLLGAGAPSASALVDITSTDPVGDFEAPGLAPQGWTTNAPYPNQVAGISSRAVTGARSLLIRDRSTSESATATRKKLVVTPSQEYFAQAYVFTTDGSQLMSLDFYDASGTRIQRYQQRTPGAHNAWSRMVIRGLAPAAARSATVQLSSSRAGVSEAWWDSVHVINPTFANKSFEEIGTARAPAPRWPTTAGPGTSISRTNDYAKTGSRSLLLDDPSTSGTTSVRSPTIPVFPGVAHEIRMWMRPFSGSFVLAVKWYSASNTLISAQTQPLSYPAGDWRLVKRSMIAPDNAAKAVLEIKTRSTVTAKAAFDHMSLLPHNGAPVRDTSTAALGQPLTFDNTASVDSVVIDGRPKLYTVVAGYPAAFQVLDIQTNEVEVNIPFSDPNLSQTGAMVVGKDGRIYLSGHGGRLWRWQTGATTLEDLGRVTPDAGAIWDLETAPDGRIWGGTSPDGMLFAFDPSSDTVVEKVRVSAAHTYARSVAVDDTHVYVGASPTNPTFFRFDVHDLADKVEIAPPVALKNGQLSELDAHDRFLSLYVPGGTTTTGARFDGSRYLYDLQTGSFDNPANVPGQRPSESDSTGGFYYFTYKSLQRVDGSTGERVIRTPTTMPAGRDRSILAATIEGVTGEWLLAFDPLTGLGAINLETFERHDYPVTFTPTASRMKSMAAGPDGKVYVGGYGGASLSVVDPATGARTQYPANPSAKDVIGEVEGMIANGQYMFLGTYTAGRIFRYDTTRPWVDGDNPTLVATLSSEGQDRPQAWATAGERTFFGTVPKYGVLGGHLGVIDTLTGTPRIVPEPVQDQSVVSLAASGDVVYGGTSRWGGLGIEPTQSTAKVFAYDVVADRKLWEVAPAEGVQSYGAMLRTPNGALWAAAGPVLYQLNPATGAVLRQVTVSTRAQPVQTTWRNVDMTFADHVIYLTAGGDVYTVDPRTLRVTKPAATSTTHPLLASLGGAVFYPNGTELMKMTTS